MDSTYSRDLSSLDLFQKVSNPTLILQKDKALKDLQRRFKSSVTLERFRLQTKLTCMLTWFIDKTLRLTQIMRF